MQLICKVCIHIKQWHVGRGLLRPTQGPFLSALGFALRGFSTQSLLHSGKACRGHSTFIPNLLCAVGRKKAAPEMTGAPGGGGMM